MGGEGICGESGTVERIGGKWTVLVNAGSAKREGVRVQLVQNLPVSRNEFNRKTAFGSTKNTKNHENLNL
jgi:hypothetical protein